VHKVGAIGRTFVINIVEQFLINIDVFLEGRYFFAVERREETN
jgi:hypothetical protein